MSYGAYVHALRELRTWEKSGRTDVEFARRKRAADDFGNWPEEVVLEVMEDLGWPRRPVGHAEILHVLKVRVSPEQQRRWLLDEEGTA